jgi:hypothetical protein
MGKPRGSPPQTKINVTSKSPVGDISVVTLIRTDTTLDHSQKAEKVCSTYARRTHPSSIVQSTWFSRRGTQRQQRRTHTHTHAITHCAPIGPAYPNQSWDSADTCDKIRKTQKKTGVALLIRHRGHCELLWAVVPPLQVVLSSACSVASLGRFPSHYLPGRPRLRRGVLADHLFGWGIPSTRQAGHVTVHSASSVKSPCGAQGGMTLPNEVACCRRRS